MAARVNELKQKQLEANATLAALLEKQSTAKAKYSGLLEQQIKLGRVLTDDERKEREKLATDAAGFDDGISAARHLANSYAEQLVAEEERAALAKPLGKKSEVSVEAPNFTKDPARGFRSPRDFFTTAIRHSGHRSVEQVEDERLRSVAVKDAGDKMAAGEVAFMLPLAFTPKHLRAGADWNGFSPIPKATVGSDEQGGYSDPYGGYAIERSLAPGFLKIDFEGDPTQGRTQAMPMSTPIVKMLARTDKDHSSSVSGGFTVTRKAETAAAAASRGQMEEIELKASSLFGLAYATEEILQDSVISFLAIIDAGFRDQFAAYLLKEKLFGQGGTEFLGILTALSSANLGPTISVAKENNQAAATVDVNNVLKMRSRCWGYGNAIWIAGYDAYPQLATLAVKIGTAGALVYQQSVEEDRPDMLLGRPIFYSEFASILGTQGDLILGNWSQYLDALYQPLQSAESIHARFVNHERTFKFWLRNAAAPWWRVPLTPNALNAAKNAPTLSPFVVLDTRA